MTSRSDLTWEILERSNLTQFGKLEIARDFADYTSEHLSSQDGLDPEAEVPSNRLAQARGEVLVWLWRMLHHKRGQVNHWPDDALEQFCDDFERVLESMETPVTI